MHVDVLHLYGVRITLDVSLVVSMFGNFAVLIRSRGLVLLVQMGTNRPFLDYPGCISRLLVEAHQPDEKHAQESIAGKVRARNHLIVEHATSKMYCVSQESVQTLGYLEFHLTRHIFFLLRHTTLTDSPTDPLASMPTCISRCFHTK